MLAIGSDQVSGIRYQYGGAKSTGFADP